MDSMMYLMLLPIYGSTSLLFTSGASAMQSITGSWEGMGSTSSSELSVLLFLVFVTLSVSMMSMQGETFLFMSVMVSSLIFFKTSSLLILYVAFESSLLPITCLILFWGYQPERVSAGFYLLFYGLISGLPLSMFLLSEKQEEMLTVSFLTTSTSLFWVATFGFLVKSPLFMFHHWLPKAHVEAPTLGSVLLAGVLLKQGTYGILVILNLFQHYYNIVFIFLSIIGSCFMVVAVMVTSDIKAWVALSSVVHMNVLLIGVFSFSSLAKSNSSLIMLLHGVTSSGMFLMAGSMIHGFSSRTFFSMQGGNSTEYTLFTMLLLCNMGVPPLISFMSEVIHFSILCSWMWGLGLIWIMNFMGVFYYCLYVAQIINKSPMSNMKMESEASMLVLISMVMLMGNVTVTSWVF